MPETIRSLIIALMLSPAAPVLATPSQGAAAANEPSPVRAPAPARAVHGGRRAERYDAIWNRQASDAAPVEGSSSVVAEWKVKQELLLGEIWSAR